MVGSLEEKSRVINRVQPRITTPLSSLMLPYYALITVLTIFPSGNCLFIFKDKGEPRTAGGKVKKGLMINEEEMPVVWKSRHLPEIRLGGGGDVE